MRKDHSTELLAPAGSADAAWAAFSYGADAVYAGLPRFSARAEAVNFSEEQLDELIGYAHAHGKKVYITFNTLVQQHELPDALKALALIDDLNTDGVIVQDMGVARMAKRFFPKLELHASTQLAVHNAAGAKLLAGIGFSRVVLARELSLNEIASISQECGIETEVFIHGALCYSYSGLCLFSSHLSGRSGNRGRCAYCCRQSYTDNNEKVLPFSMKDFAVGPYFDELLATGVASLKIEGRMKGPAYVGAVTDFYRKRIEHKLDDTEQQQLLSDIQTIFGRAATDLYLKDNDTHPIDPTTNGHRGALIGTIQSIRPERADHWLHLHTDRALQKFDGLKIELPGKEPFGFSATEIRLQNDRKKHLKFEVPADSEIAVRLPENHPYLEVGLPVYCSISQEVRQRYGFEVPRPGTYRQQRPFNATVELKTDGISACSGETQIRIDEPLSEARQPEKTLAAIRKSLGKTGGTEWKIDQLTINDNGLFVPASILNDARRTLLEKLSAERKVKRQQEHAARLEALVQPPSVPGNEEHWSIKLRDLSLLDELTEEELSRINEVVLEARSPSDRERTASIPPIRYALPVIQKNSASCILNPASRAEVANVGALHQYRKTSNLTADWPLYTLNSEAAEQWRELGISRFVLSPEDTGENLRALLTLLGDRAIIPVYQHTPLMISATPPDSGTILSDRRKHTLTVEQNDGQFVLIFEEPFSLVAQLHELRKAGARHFRIDFCYGIDNAARAADVFQRIMQEKSIPNSYAGNYDRTL